MQPVIMHSADRNIFHIFLLVLTCLLLSSHSSAQDAVWLKSNSDESIGKERNWYLNDGTLAYGKLSKAFHNHAIEINSSNGTSWHVDLHRLTDHSLKIVRETLGDEYQAYEDCWRLLGLGEPYIHRPADRKYGKVELPNATPRAQSEDRVLFSMNLTGEATSYASVMKSIIPAAELRTLFADGPTTNDPNAVVVMDQRFGKSKPMIPMGEDVDCFYVGFTGKYSKVDKRRFDEKSIKALSASVTKRGDVVSTQERNEAAIMLGRHDGRSEYLPMMNLSVEKGSIGLLDPGGRLYKTNIVDYHPDDLRFLPPKCGKFDYKRTGRRLQKPLMRTFLILICCNVFIQTEG